MVCAPCCCCAAHCMAVRAPLQSVKNEEKWSMLSGGNGKRGHFVDGGVVANNPTIAGISFLQRIYPGSNMTNTAVLSLGCGSCWSSSGLPPAGGPLRVAAPMIDIMMGANCDTAAAAGEMLYRTVSESYQHLQLRCTLQDARQIFICLMHYMLDASKDSVSACAVLQRQHCVSMLHEAF